MSKEDAMEAYVKTFIAVRSPFLLDRSQSLRAYKQVFGRFDNEEAKKALAELNAA